MKCFATCKETLSNPILWLGTLHEGIWKYPQAICRKQPKSMIIRIHSRPPILDQILPQYNWFFNTDIDYMRSLSQFSGHYMMLFHTAERQLMKNDQSYPSTCASLLSFKSFLNWFRYKIRWVLGRNDLMSQETDGSLWRIPCAAKR